MKYEPDCIRADEQIHNACRLILSPVGQFDRFASRAGEVVSAEVDPSICEVINVWEDGLIDHHLIRPARVANCIDRAFAGGSGSGNADIH